MILPHILKLPTPRLLAYYKKHYRGIGPYWSEWGMTADDERRSAEFEKDRNAIKQELDSREHVES